MLAYVSVKNGRRTRSAAQRCQGITQFGTRCAQKTRSKDKLCHHHRKRAIVVASSKASTQEDKLSSEKTTQKHNAEEEEKTVADKIEIEQVQLVFEKSVSNHDIDHEDRDDQFACAEIAEEIFRNLRQRETQGMVNPKYMANQSDINEKMRSILIDWLIVVHLKFKMRDETLFLAVQILDRFLEKQKVARNKLQLVGVTALWLAAKYEEIYPPELRDFVYICDNAYTRNQIEQMEALVLNRLEFRLAAPTAHPFARRFVKAALHGDTGTEDELAQKSRKMYNAVFYLLTLSLLDYQSLAFSPSLLTAAAVSMSSLAWSDTLVAHTRFSENELEKPVARLRELAHAAEEASLKAAWKKFSCAKFDNVPKDFIKTE